ncbi:MAG: hypothetical protein MUF45_14785, partial [Spirosomaceae bacterium]|nr:hypothetical protein [Spirosomataceae bacterium]
LYYLNLSNHRSIFRSVGFANPTLRKNNINYLQAGTYKPNNCNFLLSSPSVRRPPSPSGEGKEGQGLKY